MASSKGSERKKSGKKALSPPPIPLPGPPPKWVVVQLTSLGEREKSIDIITRAARRLLGDVEVFVPAAVQKVRDESHTMVYMDGYIFVRHAENVNFLKLQETMYFKAVLCAPGSGGKKTYCLIDDFVLDKMRDGVKNMAIAGDDFIHGQDVKVIKGQLKGLKGKVMLVYEDVKQGGRKVQVHLAALTSKPVLIEFPPNHLEKVEVA